MAGKWLGKEKSCDICKDELRRFDTFYDGRLENRSQWALMCKECWQYYGTGIGAGVGQEYSSVDSTKIRG